VSDPQPWLSVVMPTYNGERYLTTTLESIVAEGARGVELVIVDDGSTDRTLEIVDTYHTRATIRIVQQARVANWVVGTNVGLRAAMGRHASFLHQDDLWLPGRLSAVQLELDHHPDTAVLIHPAVFIGPDGTRLGTWRCPLPAQAAVDSALLFERLLIQNFIATASPVFDRDLVLRLGGLDEALWYTADWDLWLRLARAGPARFIAEPLAAFRVHPASQTMDRARSSADFRRQMETVLHRHLGASEVASSTRWRGVQRAAEFSIAMNTALAGLARGENGSWWSLAIQFLGLRPTGWCRYLRASRIAERLTSRVRLLIAGRRSLGRRRRKRSSATD
jgi:GT2 family glycosyltransferase